jgi:tetratricopeptide (TPR) repeat protein
MKNHLGLTFNLTILTLGFMLSPILSVIGINDSLKGIVIAQEIPCESIDQGISFQKSEDYKKARECFERLQSIGNPEDKLKTYYYLANIYYLSGQYIKTQRKLNEYQNLKNDQVKNKKNPDPYLQALVENLNGLNDFELGQYPSANSHYKSALENFTTPKNFTTPQTQEIATTSLSKADTYVKLSEKDPTKKGSAQTEYKSVLSLLLDLQPQLICQDLSEDEKLKLKDKLELSGLSVGYKSIKAVVELSNLSTGNCEKKLLQNLVGLITTEKYLDTVIKETSDIRTKALIYNYLGKAYHNLDKIEEAEKYYKDAEELLRLVDNYNYVRILVSKNLANLLEKKEDYQGAIEKYQNIIKITENAFAEEEKSIRIMASERELRNQIVENNFSLYQKLISLSWNKWEKATPSEKKEITQDILKFMERARTITKRSYKPDEINEIIKAVPEKTTLIEYFVTEDQLFVLLVNQKNGITILPLSAFSGSSQTSIKEAIEQFYQYNLVTKEPSCRSKNQTSCAPESLKTLYDILIKPIENNLKDSGVTKLIIVPHGILHNVPFAALNNGTKYLVENYSISMLPSAESLLKNEEPKNKVGKDKPINVVALANPTFDLLYSQDEVQAITGLSQYSLQNPLYGQNATLVKLQEALGQPEPNILHLSTHNKIDISVPLNTSLILSGDSDKQNLSRQKIDRLKNIGNINLVVLSACQTDIGEITRGDEVFGLTRTFLFAGVPSVVTSLWNIDDQASSELMKTFYTELAKGLSKSEALQKAQQANLKNPDYSHPYYWAAFVLTGDPSSIRYQSD